MRCMIRLCAALVLATSLVSWITASSMLLRTRLRVTKGSSAVRTASSITPSPEEHSACANGVCGGAAKATGPAGRSAARGGYCNSRTGNCAAGRIGPRGNAKVWRRSFR